MDTAIAGAAPTERRAASRKTSDELSWVSATRMRPGREVVLIDLSSGGALLEAGTRLLPGSRVVLQFFARTGCLLVCGRVLRCQVYTISAEHGIRYRGALVFDEALDFSREARVLSRYPVPMNLPSARQEDGHDLPNSQEVLP